MSFREVAEINFLQLVAGRDFHPSPAAWEDEVLYFLMLDRFSDGNEQGYRDNSGAVVTSGSTPLLSPADHDAADDPMWHEAGATWAGGTLSGLRGKLGYLHRLGVTAVWVSPVLKQTSGHSYHGYATQNFLDVDPHFGTASDLRDLVTEAHSLGVRVILDVVLNHAGDVFGYDPDRYPTASGFDARWDGRPYRVAGFRDASGRASLPFGSPVADLDAAVWPAELQRPDTFSAKGRIDNWDWYPEYLEGDFIGLKDISLGAGTTEGYRPSPALRTLTRVYQYWIAYADLDGFRVDTVKHMDPGAARYFASAVHEFAQSLGKENFYLIAEITGPRDFAYRTLEEVGMNAALGIADVQDQMEWLVKGRRDPRDYFGLFRDALQLGKDSHTWFRNRVVTAFDDHDQVRKGENKARFAADEAGKKLGVAAIALNALTLGIPCLYYGGEQGFDGHGPNDRYLREAMFGGSFGPFRSRGAHAFDEDNETYRQVSRILSLRRTQPALRRGRQYLRQISGDGVNFGYPQLFGGEMRSVVAWSRLFAGTEAVAAINTDPDNARTAWVTIDDELHPLGAKLTCLFSTDRGQEGQTLDVEPRNGKAVELTVPAGGCVIYS
ncbi:alpha-amylase family glycosyl hydrolase [Actinoplanes solisilvae]|uniref:alpha-amylase family glycosyl hydrolase n=1 Tax=Actinoplanes solisilvae TaxID=2486853 RepID=UPI000FDBE8CF|nr:alpha-amylase family glycosyl hydrolase [Actinoplanes solisilvae]